MNVVVFGTYDPVRHPRIGVIAEGISAHGHRVVELNEPLGINTDEKVKILRQPWRLVVLVGRLLRSWWRLRQHARQAPQPDAVVVGYMGHFDVHAARRLFPGIPIALDHLIFAADTALDRGERGYWKVKLLRWLDRAALSSADIIVLDTDGHRELVPRSLRSRCVVVPVGASGRWFSEFDVEETENLKVIFFGLFTPLQGASVIGEAIGRLADAPIHFTMVGTGQDYDQTRLLANESENVTWIPWLEPKTLTTAVAKSDVCLGIFGTGPKALRVVPNKVFQGAAAGCAIVTSDSPPQRTLLGDAAILVPAGDAEALAQALRDLAEDREAVRDVRRACRELANERFRPAKIAAPLVAVLEGVVADVADVEKRNRG